MKLKYYIFYTLNLILEPFGCGFDWSYYNLQVNVWNGWKEEYDDKVIFACRKNKYSGNHYYWTKMCGTNGYNPNKWELFNGKKFELYKGYPKP
ncbi:hypothetical protein [Salinimicrobium sp. GXAS 041]|uniref:hypothetical protein n=1 Tax=Salinimicrobium sp. GXAS 041 TaxID=3400806 RepID=UPI003C79231C